MSTNTKPTTAKRPEGYTKSAWEADTFRVYNGLIKLVKSEITLAQFVSHPTVKSLCEGCGITKGQDEKTALKTRSAIVVSLLVGMAKDRTSHGEKERHINPISGLRAFFNGGWKDKAALPVTYTEPKAPKTPEKAKSTKTAKEKPVKPITINDVPEEVKNAILAEYYKANHKAD